ncbi:MAG: hypothetical protein KDK74_11485 [Cephaloticoccus sp.]|nr:hypothetical protein [Cephaloticoccus sp.]
MARTLAILIGLGCVVLGLLYLRSTRTSAELAAQLTALRSANQQQLAELNQAEQAQVQLQKQLLELDADLGATKIKLTEAESTKVQIGREMAAARNELQQLTAAHARLRAESVQLKDQLAQTTPVSPDEVARYQATIARLENELAALRQTPAVAGPVLATNRTRSTIVMSVGPADAFVVLNYGASHGALPAQKFLIQRGTETVGTALISDVRDQYSIAQVDPQSLRGALHKGDSAVIAK